MIITTNHLRVVVFCALLYGLAGWLVLRRGLPWIAPIIDKVVTLEVGWSRCWRIYIWYVDST
jgi:hypothetical protein